MIVDETVMYFRGIDYFNRTIERLLAEALDPAAPRTPGERLFAQAQRELGGNDDYIRQLRQTRLDPDPPVVAAIEARLRDGLLTTASRDKIAAAAPPGTRDRFARIDPPKSKCPAEPWWAFWR
jgi:hypothetical protein